MLLTPVILMAKAERACVSAKTLLELDDKEGACNRAYYAMYDAARAGILAAKVDVSVALDRRHSSVIHDFGQHLVNDGPISDEMHRLLKRAAEVRIIADYKGDAILIDDVKELVEQATVFVAAMRVEFLLSDLL